MTSPLALLVYENLMPGSQLVNRLQDLNYRVHTISEAEQLLNCAQNEGPMLIFLDLEPVEALGLITHLRATQTTAHIPLIAFAAAMEERLEAGKQQGATLAVSEAALLSHLPGLLEQALRIE